MLFFLICCTVHSVGCTKSTELMVHQYTIVTRLWWYVLHSGLIYKFQIDLKAPGSVIDLRKIHRMDIPSMYHFRLHLISLSTRTSMTRMCDMAPVIL